MGCFSVTCVLSGLSIYSQDAVYIPLMPAKYTKLNDKGQVTFEITDNYVSNDGAFGMFVPKYLPVFGSCDTYGRLEAIETSAIYEIYRPELEEMYKEYKEEYGCFVDRTMWNWAVKNSRRAINVYNNYAVGKYIELYARELGFVFEGMNNNERYNRVFYHLSNPNVKFLSDGEWLEGSIYSFKDLTRFCIKNNVSLLNSDFLKTISPYELNCVKAIIKHRNLDLDHPYDKYSFDRDTAEFRHILHLFDTYKLIEVSQLAQAIADLMHFARSMYQCNRMFIPQMSGTQTGDFSTQKKMYRKAISVCNSLSGY